MPSRVWQHKTFLRTTTCPFSWFCHARNTPTSVLPFRYRSPMYTGLSNIINSSVNGPPPLCSNQFANAAMINYIYISFVFSWPTKTCQYAGTCSTLFDGVRLNVAAFRGLCSISAYQWPHNPVVIVTQVCRPIWPIVTGNYYALAIFIGQIPWSTDV